MFKRMVLAALVSAIVVRAASAAGSPFTLLHSFQYATDGAYPEAGLVADALGELYGTTSFYGPSATGSGTVFKIKSDGTGFAVIHSFSQTDGDYSLASLVLDSTGFLYGTTDRDSGSGCGGDTCGEVFKVKTDGTGFAVLHAFAGPDGEGPASRLLLDGSGFLYGTASIGGSGGAGVVFKLKTDGTGFAVLHSFSKAEGTIPVAGLILDADGHLYGTASEGGVTGKCIQEGLSGDSFDLGCGSVFTLKTDGTEFAVLHLFVGTDGATPNGDLVLDSGGTLYGTTNDENIQGNCLQAFQGTGCGSIFKLRTDGTAFMTLRAFSKSAADGANPTAGLTFASVSSLYGSTLFGGANGQGIIFSINTDGSGFSLLHSFANSTSDGRGSEGDLIVNGSGNIFGTTSGGGASSAGFGTIFRLVPQAPAGTGARGETSPISAVPPIRVTGRKH